MRYRYAGVVLVIVRIAASMAICGCASREPAAPFPHPSCRPLPGIAERFGTLVFALTDPVDPLRGPDLGNASERIVFRSFYETLVTADCAGQVGPGLAESWTSAENGRVWVFTLREDARFWNGVEVLPGHVKWAWSFGQGRHEKSARPNSSPWRWLDARSDSVIELDGRRLMVRLSAPVGKSPVFFAHDALAVADRRFPIEDDHPWPRVEWHTSLNARPWPMGTGPYRPLDRLFEGADREAHDVICVPNDHHPEGRAGPRRLVFRVRAGRDARDLLTQDVIALALRDRASEDYFEAAADFDVVPLPWDRIHVLFSPVADEGWPPRGRGSEIARDVVFSDARPAESILFGDAPEADCAALLRAALEESNAPIMAGRPQRILYDAADRDAQSLAERLAFLADVGGPVVEFPPRAVGLPAAELASALRSRSDDAFVLGLSRAFASDCLMLADLAASADGLEAPVLDALARLSPDGKPAPVSASTLADDLARSGRLIPLVATRPHLAARQGLTGVTVDADGALRFAHAGFRAEDDLP